MGDTLGAKRSAMKKYWHVLNIGIQNNLTYRLNFPSAGGQSIIMKS